MSALNNVVYLDVKSSATIPGSETLQVKLQRYLELQERVKEYEILRKELKTLFTDIEETQVGPFKITGKIVVKKSFVMPETIYWDMKIKKI